MIILDHEFFVFLYWTIRWFLVETNYDHWTTPPPSDDRRHPAEKALTKLTQEKLAPQSLFKVMSVHPVLNNRTVYTTIMQAKHPDVFNTWIQRPSSMHSLSDLLLLEEYKD